MAKGRNIRRKCMRCKRNYVDNSIFDLCELCFYKQEKKDNSISSKEHFERELQTRKIHSVYIMIYGDKYKIGYTNDLRCRILEIKASYPNNRLIYLREFTKESEARRFEVWLKKLSDRELLNVIMTFHDKSINLHVKDWGK